MSRKPSVFIGCSSEGLRYAQGLQFNFRDDSLRVSIWDQAVFKPTHTFLDSLTNIAAEYDFGIFIFTPDDLL
jgi:predicted nucleotide-binding protein